MVTIILLSRDTSKYLKRALTYYKEIKFKGRIFVADSSCDDEKVLVQEIIREIKTDLFCPIYFDYGHGTKFGEKVADVVEKVCTPYVLLASMDDFFSVQAIREGMFFLRDHSDYSFVAGYTYGYTYQGNLLEWYYTGDCDHPRSLAQPNSLERVDSYLASYTSTFHMLFRTADLIPVLQQSLLYANDPYSKFLENMVTILTLLSGKGKYLNVPFAWREQRETSIGAKYYEKWLLDENFETYARSMEFGIAKSLEEIIKMSSKNAALKSRYIMQRFIEYNFNCIFPDEQSTGVSVKKLIKRFSPSCAIAVLKLLKKSAIAIKRASISGEHFLYDERSPYCVEFNLVNRLIKDSKIYAYRSGIEDLKISPKIIKDLRSHDVL